MIRPLIILGLASLILQGCAELSWPPRGEATVPADAASSKSSGAAAESPPTPPRKPSQTAALPATSQEPSDGQPKPEVGSLLGLDFAAVRELLGVPALEEIQAPATVWVYNGRGCVLNIFFYFDVKHIFDVLTNDTVHNILFSGRKKTIKVFFRKRPLIGSAYGRK